MGVYLHRVKFIRVHITQNTFATVVIHVIFLIPKDLPQAMTVPVEIHDMVKEISVL